MPGDQPTAYTPPGWPYLLGGFALVGDDVTAVRLAHATLVAVAAVALAGLVAFQPWGARWR